MAIAPRFHGPVVPQARYLPINPSDQRRYIEETHLNPPITFISQDPYGLGIRINDALQYSFNNLVGRDDTLFHGSGKSVSIRINVSCAFASPNFTWILCAAHLQCIDAMKFLVARI